MFILIYLFSVLTAFCLAQSLPNDQKPQYRTKPPANKKQWQYIYQGEKNWNYMQRNRTKPKQQPMVDASVVMKSRINMQKIKENSMQKIKERDILMRRGEPGKSEGRTPARSVPRAKANLYTGTNVPTNTEMPATNQTYETDMFLISSRERPAIAGKGKKIPGLLWPKDMDMPEGFGRTINMDNLGLKLQLNNARRSNNHDIPHNTFEKSEIPTDEQRKTLKNIDEQLTKYKNGIYKLFKPNYVRYNPHVEAIKKQDLPIDAKVHTVLKTLKKVHKGAAHFAALEDISDISV